MENEQIWKDKLLIGKNVIIFVYELRLYYTLWVKIM